MLKSEGSCMNGLLLDHFWQLMIVLYGHMPAIEVCVKLFEAEAH